MGYPRIDVLSFSVTVPEQTAGLQLKAWQLVLEPGSEYSFPGDLPPGFLAITWKGSVCVDPEPGSTCDEANALQWAGPASPGTQFVAAGGEPAVLLVVGILGEQAPDLGEALQARGKTVLAFAPVPGGTIEVLVHLLDLNCRNRVVTADPWPRPCFVLTSLNGPTPVVYSTNPSEAPLSNLQGRLTASEVASADLDIYLVKVPGNTWLSFQDGPEDAGETRAIVCDFLAAGDEDPDRVEGCTWRCHGHLI